MNPVLLQTGLKSSAVNMEIELRKGESIDSALRRLKKSVTIEGTLREVRERRHFVKPSEKKKLRMKKAKFEQYLRNKRLD